MLKNAKKTTKPLKFEKIPNDIGVDFGISW